MTGVSIDQVSAVPILAGIGCTFINFKVAVFTIEARSTSTLIVIKSILNGECTRIRMRFLNFEHNLCETCCAVCSILAGFKMHTLISLHTAISSLPANRAVTFVSCPQLLDMHEIKNIAKYFMAMMTYYHACPVVHTRLGNAVINIIITTRPSVSLSTVTCEISN